MKRIGAKRNTSISAIGAAVMGLVIGLAACGTNPVVADLSSGASPLAQSAVRPSSALAAITTTTIAAGTRTAGHGSRNDRPASDWEGQRWDLGLISHIDPINRTIAFDREQIADPDGAFQSGPTITAEPIITSSSQVKNENTRLRSFVLSADPELLRPTVATGCPTAAADWQTFSMSDLLTVRSPAPQTLLSFDESGRVVRIRLFQSC